VFARALITTDTVLQKSEFNKIRAERYTSFDIGKGKDLEE
jgi:xylose isomerase